MLTLTIKRKCHLNLGSGIIKGSVKVTGDRITSRESLRGLAI